jgi:hypothetical protein
MDCLDNAYFDGAKGVDEVVTRFVMAKGLLTPFLP